MNELGANTGYFFLLLVLVLLLFLLMIAAIMYLRIPCSSRIRKVPPMSTINRIIARPVVIVSEPKTSTNAPAIFHH